MNKFKKIFGFLFIVLLSIALIGCKKDETPDDNNDDTNINDDNNQDDQNQNQENADEAYLTEQMEFLYFGDVSQIVNDIQLPKYIKGNKELAIEWTSSDSEVIDIREYADPELSATFKLAYVEMKPEIKKVTLTATVTYKGITQSKNFEVTVLADEYIGYDTIALAKAKEGKSDKQSKVKFQGVVSYTTASGFVVTDETASMYCYGSNHGRKAGEEVIVRGLWTYYNNMVQIASGCSVKVLAETTVDLNELAEEKSISEIFAIETETIDPINTTRIFKTTFELKENAAGSYNKYRMVDPLDSTKYLDVSKYNDQSSFDEIETLIAGEGETKYYEGIVIIYCSRSAGAEGLWDVLYVAGSAKEVQITLTDEQKISGVATDLYNSLNGLLVVENIDLPTADEKTGATISWASDNEGVIAADGTFVAPNKKTNVKLTATIQLNEAVETVEITVTAKAEESHYNYIYEARAAYLAAGADVANVRVEGVVTNVIGNTVFLQDGDYALQLYNCAGHGLKVGDNAYIEGGLITSYNGLYEIKKSGDEDRKVGLTKNVYTANSYEITEYSKDALNGLDNALVSIYNLEYVSGTMEEDSSKTSGYKGSNIKFKTADGTEVTVRNDAYMDATEAQALAAKFAALTAGDIVSIVDANLGWYNGPQICPSAASQIQGENTIKTVRSSYAGSDIENVTVKGVVTNVAGNSYYVQDGYYAIMIYNQKDHGHVVGDSVTVTGTLTVYNGLYEIKNASSEKIEEEFAVKGLELTSANYDKESLAGKDNMICNFENLVYVSGTMQEDSSKASGYKASNIVFETLSGVSVTARNDAYINAEDAAKLAEIINGLQAGDIVSLRGVALGWYNGPQITLLKPSEVHVNTIAKVRASYSGSDIENVTIEGVVTGVLGNTYYVQDGDYAMMIYNQKDHGLVLGDTVSVTGTLTVYNGLYEIKNASCTKIEKEFSANWLVLTSENYDKESLNGKDNVLCAMYALEYVSGTMQEDSSKGSGYKASSVKFKTADGVEVTLRNDAYMNAEAAAALAQIVNSLKAGDIVNFENAALGWYNGPQITPLGADAVVVVKTAE